MGVIFESGYTLPGSDEPLTHARIAHSGNWHTGGTPAASTTDSDFFEDGPDNSLTYEKWKPTAVTATWENDLGSAKATDYCVIGAHNMGTQGNSLQVQYWTGSTWSDLIATTAITDDMPIMTIFEPETRQRFRIRITNGSVPTIGVIKFGSALQMPRPIYGGHSPLDLARQTQMRSNKSGTGEFLGRTKQRVMFQTSFDWQHLDAAWVRTNWRPFQLALEEEPFFIAWRPIDFSEVGLCYTSQMPIPSNMGIRDLMSVSLGATGYGYD